MLFDHVDHEPLKISRRHLYQYTRNRELVSLTTERTDGSATRDREVRGGPLKKVSLLGGHPCIILSLELDETRKGARETHGAPHTDARRTRGGRPSRPRALALAQRRNECHLG